MQRVGGAPAVDEPPRTGGKPGVYRCAAEVRLLDGSGCASTMMYRSARPRPPPLAFG